ncbi:Uncharacterised protein [Mycobacteroides abscessus subsp. abscessus]|nr:Uncharacterised protein [Mycobacteroides abscessus subsp. abscessus]
MNDGNLVEIRILNIRIDRNDAGIFHKLTFIQDDIKRFMRIFPYFILVEGKSLFGKIKRLFRIFVMIILRKEPYLNPLFCFCFIYLCIFKDTDEKVPDLFSLQSSPGFRGWRVFICC